MGKPFPVEYPWRVRVAGRLHGAGVLLDERHVLTCAHLMDHETGTARVEGAAGSQEWASPAREAPGTRVSRNEDTLRGDVALLRLDRPAPPGLSARLWRAPLSGGRVRAFGYPDPAAGGSPADAELGGDGGHGGELGLLKPVSPEGPWSEPGFSGAGVVMLDGGHAGHVIGIVVGAHESEPARAAWMMPTETIHHYLPDIGSWVAGQPADRLNPPDGGLPSLPDGDTLRIELTRELARLLTSGWAGSVVIPGDTATGISWLVRLVRTADPATRARASPADISGAPRGTCLELGAIDAAYDARGKSVEDITRYLSERFGLPAGQGGRADRAGLADRLLRRVPPVSLVIANIDQAASPGDLIRELVRPLSAGARLRGARLVLGFAGPPPSERTLPYEVLLDSVPPSGTTARRPPTPGYVEARVAELAAAEETVAARSTDNEHRFRRPPVPPPARSQRLRVQLAVAAAGETDADLAAIDGEVETARGDIESFMSRSAGLDEMLEGLRSRLDANWAHVEGHFGAEDRRLGELYVRARDALYDAPFDLAAARDLVDAFVAEANRRLADEEGRMHGDGRMNGEGRHDGREQDNSD